MLKIVLDFDEIFYSLISEGIDIYNKKYNKQLKPSDIKEYIVPKKILECFGEVKYRKGDKDNAIRYTKELISMGYDVYILTASMKENLMEKIQWIENHIPELGYDKIIVAKNKHLVKADVIVDDYRWNVVGHPAKYKFLMDAPHNQDVVDGDDIIRVKTLKEVVDFLKEVGYGTNKNG